jgi:hypothetical protein
MTIAAPERANDCLNRFFMGCARNEMVGVLYAFSHFAWRKRCRGSAQFADFSCAILMTLSLAADQIFAE